VVDDFDGLGPETIQAEELPEGEYGLIVEPVFDDRDAGANTFLRLLWNGRLVVPAPIGPQFLTSTRGELWIAGTLTIAADGATWRPLGDILPPGMAPTRPPADWPEYY
jgi:hypothetical protein